MDWTATEYVNGIVIGPLTRPYRFYALDGKKITDVQWFSGDAEAIDWWLANCGRYGRTRKDRVEMRAYNRAGR